MNVNSSRWIWVLICRALLYGVCGAILTALWGGFCGGIVGGLLTLAGGPDFGSMPISGPVAPPPSPPRSLADALPGLIFGGAVCAINIFPLGFLAFFIGGLKSNPHEKGSFFRRPMFRSLAIWTNAGLFCGAFLGALATASFGAAFALAIQSDIADMAINFTIIGAPILMLVGGVIGSFIGARRARKFYLDF